MKVWLEEIDEDGDYGQVIICDNCLRKNYRCICDEKRVLKIYNWTPKMRRAIIESRLLEGDFRGVNWITIEVKYASDGKMIRHTYKTLRRNGLNYAQAKRMVFDLYYAIASTGSAHFHPGQEIGDY